MDERIEELELLANDIQESGMQFPDIRLRDWMNGGSKAGKILTDLIEIENLLDELDQYSIENGLDYDAFEDLNLQIGEIRKKFTYYVDENEEITAIK